MAHHCFQFQTLFRCPQFSHFSVFFSRIYIGIYLSCPLISSDPRPFLNPSLSFRTLTLWKSTYWVFRRLEITILNRSVSTVTFSLKIRILAEKKGITNNSCQQQHLKLRMSCFIVTSGLLDFWEFSLCDFFVLGKPPFQEKENNLGLDRCTQSRGLPAPGIFDDDAHLLREFLNTQ